MQTTRRSQKEPARRSVMIRPREGTGTIKTCKIPSEDPGDGHRLPFVSVIMPTKDERPCIERCIDGFLHQSYPRERFEVVVADQSGDGTREILGEYARRFPGWLRLYDNPTGRTVEGYNIAWRIPEETWSQTTLVMPSPTRVISRKLSPQSLKTVSPWSVARSYRCLHQTPQQLKPSLMLYRVPLPWAPTPSHGIQNAGSHRHIGWPCDGS